MDLSLIKSYIISKHREAQLIIAEKMANNDTIFNFQDDEGNNIAETIYYENENDNEVKMEQYKFILLGNKQIIGNLKNN